jgi:hypothetical protein
MEDTNVAADAIEEVAATGESSEVLSAAEESEEEGEPAAGE